MGQARVCHNGSCDNARATGAAMIERDAASVRMGFGGNPKLALVKATGLAPATPLSISSGMSLPAYRAYLDGWLIQRNADLGVNPSRGDGPAANAAYDAAVRSRAGGTPAGGSSAPNNAQFTDHVVSLVTTAASGVLAIVQGALASDRAAREAEATAAAARILAARSDAERASVAGQAAQTAYDKARLAETMLPGDRAGATTRLSEGQGAFAGAVGTRDYFLALPAHTAPPALVAAIESARAKLEEAALRIEAAPNPPQPTPDNPVTHPDLGTPAWSTPVKVAYVAVPAVVGFYVAGPVGALVGAGIGAAADYFFGRGSAAT